MSERDELLKIIREGHDAWLTPREAGEMALTAERILAAGYRKPRTITTTEELDALPEGAVIYLIEMAAPAEKFGYEWVFIGNPRAVPTASIPLPATVLYEPFLDIENVAQIVEVEQ